MLNLDETLFANKFYLCHFDIYLKPIAFSLGSFILVSVLRAQIPEINLLQLIPGSYLIFLFSSFFFLIFFSELVFRVPQEFDNQRLLGAKTKIRLQGPLSLKFSYLLIASAGLYAVYLLIPLSLDCFDLYAGSTLENIWSFDEVINLDIIFLTLFFCLAQLPCFGIYFLTNEKAVKTLPKNWKIITIVATIFAGIVTPTVDGPTQFNFSAFSMLIYLLIIYIIEKRANVKFIGLNSLLS